MIAAPAAGAVVPFRWTSALLEGNNDGTLGFTGVSCPTSRLCAVVDSAGNVFTSTNPVATTPTNGASVWKHKDIDGSTVLSSISCLPTLCVAADRTGHVIVSTDPFKSSPAWSSPVAIDAPNGLTGIACPATNLCVAIDNNGQVVTSTQPAGGVSTWKKASLDLGSGHVFNAVSCPTTKFCLALETVLGSTRQGNSFSSTNPAGGASAWTKHAAIDTASQFFDFQGLDCLSTALCVGLDEIGNGGQVLTSTAPATSTAWKQADVDKQYHTPFGVSCATPTLCLMVDDNGRDWVSTNPTGGVPAWTIQEHVDPRWGLTGISCSKQAVCVAIDQAANLFVGHLLPPNTRITSSSIKQASHSATFAFTATGLVSGFQCALRKQGKSAKFAACKSPKAYKGLAAGTYAFLVRGFNLAGADPTPASKGFTIK